MTTAPIDLDAVWQHHVETVLADRDAPDEIHASDLHSCAFALKQRITGVPQLPFNDDSFANFERGYAYETRLHEALVAYAIPKGFAVTRGEEVQHRGIIGNLDFVLYRGDVAEAVVDLSTTAGKSPDWKYGHALKSAFYAVAKGAPVFCEAVLQIGFGGVIKAVAFHWFALDDEFEGVTWRELVDRHINWVTEHVPAMTFAHGLPTPPMDPLTGEAETWRCGKPRSGRSYCRARCANNAAYVDAAGEVF